VSFPWWAGVLCATPFYAGPIASALIGPLKPNLRDFEPLPRDRSPGVSVILPARNEAENLERCARSILAGDYPDLELIVVDDRSTDDTGAIAERLAREDARMRVIRGADLPAGWFGKPWACWQGFQAAAGTLLLFTDADTVHGPRLLSLAVAALDTEHAEMVTLMPLQEMTGFWERAVQPFFFLLLSLRFGLFGGLNRTRNPRDAIANGQFILVTRDSYEWIGGHRRVSDTVIEDLMLAKRYVEAGKRIFLVLADQDMRTRMYASLGAIVEGWSKNYFMGVLETTGSKSAAYVAALGAVWIPLYFAAPFLALAADAPLRSHGYGGGGGILAFGVAGFVGATWLIATVLRAQRAPWPYALAHPLGALVQAYIFLRAAWRGTGRIEWKGRTYSHP
jgi:chlorobactene glucosyltransferase